MASPLVAAYFLRRCLQEKGYRERFGERLGFLPAAFRQRSAWAIWVHAVSVGEVLAAGPLLERLAQQLPGVPVYLSVATMAGRKVAEERLGEAVAGIFWAPLDYRFAVRGVLRQMRPRVVVVLETEIWPHFYREVKRSGAALVVANGRISDRAFSRYRRWRWFFAPVLALVDQIFAESECSGQRYLALGVAPERVQAAGNVKYSIDPSRKPLAAELVEFFARVTGAEVWVAASTMPGADAEDVDEDEFVIRVFQQLAERREKLLLVLAPRKPERFEVAAQRLESAGVRFVRRSRLTPDEALSLPGVLLLDSIGELAGVFRYANVVFMGGTLARRGGHNILEPAWWGKPILLGPHMENFPEIAAEFRQAGAVMEVSSEAGFIAAWERLAADEALRQRLGEAARELARREAEAAEICTAAIAWHYGRHYPRAVWPAGVSELLVAGALVWRAGAALDQAWRKLRQRRLSTPVVSVGGITMGGAGKTPLVVWLWKELQGRGIRAGVLTRGYRRRDRQERVVLTGEPAADAATVGDEPALMMRAGVRPLAIAADRFRAGRRLELMDAVDVFLLDDGFQHQQLARDLDIVVLDSKDLLGGSALFPAGRLRQPLKRLAQADVLVVSRAVGKEERAGAREELRKHNGRAPIHFATLKVEGWRGYPGGERREIRGRRVGYFCGIGNPSGFEQVIRQAGLKPECKWVFRDHHRYTIGELRRMVELAEQRGLECLLTTDKDLANLPEGARAALGSVEVLWPEVSLDVSDEEELVSMVEHLVIVSERKSGGEEVRDESPR